MAFFSEVGYVKHLCTERGIRVTTSPKDVEHIFVITKPREDARFNLREIPHNELVPFGSHNRFA